MKDFPLYFSIILRDGFDSNILHQHGYDNFRWFMGDLNQSILGFDWRGKTSTKTVTGLLTWHDLYFLHLQIFGGKITKICLSVISILTDQPKFFQPQIFFHLDIVKESSNYFNYPGKLYQKTSQIVLKVQIKWWFKLTENFCQLMTAEYCWF